MARSLFIISGEESGDRHGAALLAELHKLVPGLRVRGMGGEMMRREGLTGLDSSELSVVGIIEVLEKSPQILKAMKGLKRTLASEPFDCAVFIDFPDFNLRMAKEARRLGIPVVYYISPQVWAWRKNRVGKIAKLVDKMLVVFPFEVEIYRKAGVDVEYVGHPLSDKVTCPLTRAQARKSLGLPADGTVIALLPGSRTAEVRRHLPLMCASAPLIEKGLGERPTLVVPAAASIDPGQIRSLAGSTDIVVVKGEMYTVLRSADAAVVASGTATLETALIGTPMVIIYSISTLTYGIAKVLVGVKRIGLPNIVAGRDVVTELIQNEARAERIAEEVLDILMNDSTRAGIEEGYSEIKEKLGSAGVAEKAARAVFRVMMKDGAGD